MTYLIDCQKFSKQKAFRFSVFYYYFSTISYPELMLVVDITQFNNWLNERQRFACTLMKVAVLLDDRTNIPLEIPNAIDEEADKKQQLSTAHKTSIK